MRGSVVSLGLLFLSLYTGGLIVTQWTMELLGRFSLLETGNNDNYYEVPIQLYGWLGGVGWALFLLFVPQCTFFRFLPVVPEYYTETLSMLRLWAGFVLWMSLGISANVEPGKRWRNLQLAEEGMRMGNTTEIGCWLSETPTALTIPPSAAYVDLSDNTWYPDWERRVTETKSGWDFQLVPLAYNGTVQGCAFAPPVYVACIMPHSSLEACGFHSPGYPVTIRRLRVSYEMEPWIRKDLPWTRIANTFEEADDYIFEWDSMWREDVVDFINRVYELRDTQRLSFGITWLATTVAPFLFFFLWKPLRGEHLTEEETAEAPNNCTNDIMLDDLPETSWSEREV